MNALVAAAHEARRAKRPREAAQLFARAGLPFEAGICFSEAGDLDDALAHLVTVPTESPRYRSACVRAILVSDRLGALSFDVDNFVAAFLRTDCSDASEVDAFYKVALLYQANGFDIEAQEALARVLRADSGHAAAAQRLTALAGRKTTTDYAQKLEQDVSFWAPPRRPTVPDVEPAFPPAVTTAPPSPSVSLAGVSAVAASSGPPAAPSSGLRAGSMAFETGILVANRYTIDRELGRGGMGIVYAAHDNDLGEVVALKVFASRIDDQALVARFKLELTLTRQLTHENVIRLHDMGVDQGMRFITMELLTGESLKAKLGQVTFRAVLGYLSQICAGLNAIHARDVVHRDIKPANLWVTSDDVVKLMDFGLAKRNTAGGAEEGGGITVSGFMAGTPGFMPPEQVTSFGSVTTAADMYALGVVAYELLTGRRPFRHKLASQIFRLQYTTDAVPMRSLNRALPAELDALVLRLLDRDPSARPSAAEARAVIDRLRATHAR